MRHWLAFGALIAGAPGAIACQSSTFACQSDGACPDGRCEPQGWCSFPDESCPSGYRFGDHAAEGLASVCVDSASDETESTSTTTTTTSSSSTAPTSEPTSTTSASETTSGTAGNETTTTTSTTLPIDETSSSTTWDITFTSGSSGTTTSDTTTESTGPVSPVTVTVPIIEDADDGAIYYTPQDTLIWAPSGETDQGDGFFGEYPDGEYYVAYFRFSLPEEMNAGELLDARIEFEATDQVTYFWSDAHAARAWVELSDDAPVVSSGASFPWELGGPPTVGVSLIEGTVRWPEAGNLTWSAEVNTTPNLTPLINELRSEVDGLSSGDHIQFWFSVAEPTGTGGEVTYVDFAADPNAAPRLVLTFAP